MRMNTLKPGAGSRQVPRRVGRGIGSGLGKTCGRGHKGQYARSGKGKVKPGFEGGQMPIQRRLPKVGFRSKMSFDAAEITLYRLNEMKESTLDLAVLHAANLIPTAAKRVKVIKKGEITRAIHLKGIAATAGAKAAILAAGGSVE